MQVSSVNNTNPSFQQINKVVILGAYKKAPEEATRVLEAVKQNDTVMDFCKKWDTSIFLRCKPQDVSYFQSDLIITYKQPKTGNKFKDFVRSFINFFKNEKHIDCMGYENGITRATDKLINGIGQNGTLETQITHIENEIAQKEKAKIEKSRIKQDKKQAEQNEKTKMNNAQTALTDTINSMLGKE